MSVGQSVVARALQNELRSLVKIRSRRDAMQCRQVTKIFVWSSPARLVSQCGPLTSVEKGSLAECSESGDYDKKEDKAANAHMVEISRIALTFPLANSQEKINCHPGRSERPYSRSRRQVLLF